MIKDALGETVHLMTTGDCNLRCPMCWGVSHEITGSVNPYQWGVWVMTSLRLLGVKNLTWTGGEPLMQEEIFPLMMAARMYGFRNTLSTNCLLLERSQDILDWVHEIGIPLDGSTPQINALTRIGNTKAFSAAVNALENITPKYPQVETTVRTVVSQLNVTDIENIGNLVNRLRPNRWKLYEVTPIGYAKDDWDALKIEPSDFDNAIEKAKDSLSGVQISVQRISDQIGRYVFIGPQGEIYEMGTQLEEKYLGNIYGLLAEAVPLLKT
jgi:Fe-coproporphyrin III synthase